MIDGLTPYPEMKANGVEWLGDVPAHWEILRAKRLLKPVEIPALPDDEIVTCFRDGQVTLRTNRRANGFMIALLEQGYQHVRPGQLVVHSMDAFAGAIGISDSDGKCTPEYIICDPRSQEIDLRYYSWALRQAANSGYILASSPAVRERAPRLRYPGLAELRLPVPSLDEQRLIVRFLDWHGVQTAKLIRGKRKLVLLLSERKQAVIHRAVTGGAGHTKRTKFSGLAWLGDVPEDWKIQRLRSVSSHITSGSRGWSRYAADQGPFFIRIANLSRNGLYMRYEDSVRLALPSEELGEASRTRAKPGDLLLSITAFIGSVAVVPDDLGEAYVSQHVACCRLIPEVNARWVGYVLLSPVGQTHGTLSMYGGTKQGLSLDDVKNYVVLLPPRPIQDKLVKLIDRSTKEISESISAVENEIALVQEFRTRLVADVVTGKLDVRSAAASLPAVADAEPADVLADDDDLDEAADAFEDEEVAA